ncbi:magnesium transporter CorA family protein [Bacillus mesophilum]|uniref:Mg2+ transporter protein, CorA-like protein n=1 Tax=Bacillus mesophilum TaxID=1071718 RepID=A0A7V7RKM9_9BACI|nr:magnesium transporter CorA family protein [Bacillus mesophilum]KAB2331884.1 Mg2+ transporter protein, CorA-like protein [Bacillus mesophilum]
MGQEFKYSNWKWLHYNHEEELDMKITPPFQEVFKIWIDSLQERDTNVLTIDSTKPNAESVRGSLIYQQTIEEQRENRIFHYFITVDSLYTVGFDLEAIDVIEEDTLMRKMEQAQNGIEGFFVLLGEILSYSIKKIDQFEIRLNDLLWKVKKKNSIKRLEEIYKLRHELLVWKNLMIPIKELEIGINEAFGSEDSNLPEYKRICSRIKRGSMLIQEYQDEINTLVNFEEMVSTHRGNEIMKTLTVITTLFTPVSAWGALWGMNFKLMPELDWRLGYPLSLLIIIGSTAALYILLIKKGWMGDILKGRKKNSFFK